MSKVFSELGFVKMEDGMITFLETTTKRDLAEAPANQKRENLNGIRKKIAICTIY